MKTKLNHIIPVLVWLCLGSFTSQKSPVQPRFKYVPEDMVLMVPGKQDALKPFLISNHLTTKKEYITYILWVYNNHRSNPQMITGAFPHDTTTWIYLFDPRYENTPVTGLSNDQIRDYCIWSTNKLNEFILLKEGLIDYPFERDDNFFNLETFSVGLYQPRYKANKDPEHTSWSSGNGTRYDSLFWADRYFYPNQRIPTATELSYAFLKKAEFLQNKTVTSSYISFYYNRLADSWVENYANEYGVHEFYIRMFLSFDRKKHKPEMPAQTGYYNERCLDEQTRKKANTWRNYAFFELFDKPMDPLKLMKDSTGYIFYYDAMIMGEEGAKPLLVKYSSVNASLEKNMEYNSGSSHIDTTQYFTYGQGYFRYNTSNSNAGFRLAMFAPETMISPKRK